MSGCAIAWSSCRRLSAVVGDHLRDFAGGVDLHVLAGLGALLVHVVEDDALEPPHEIHELEAQVRIDVERPLEIGAQRGLAGHSARRIPENLDRDRRDQHDVVRVVRHDAVEVVAVPRLHPVIGELSRLVFLEHLRSFQSERPPHERHRPFGRGGSRQYRAGRAYPQRVGWRFAEFGPGGTPGGRYGLTGWKDGPAMTAPWWTGSGVASLERSRIW